MVFTASPRRRLVVAASSQLARPARHNLPAYGVASRSKSSPRRRTDAARARGGGETAIAHAREGRGSGGRRKSRGYTPARARPLAAAPIEREEGREERGKRRRRRRDMESGGAPPPSSRSRLHASSPATPRFHGLRFALRPSSIEASACRFVAASSAPAHGNSVRGI